MLAGEYSVIAGSEALTLPFRKFHASLAGPGHGGEDGKESNATLARLNDYLRSLPAGSFIAEHDTGLLSRAVRDGMYISSSIPQGYGVGSSGAVTALIYDQFFSGHETLNLLQQRQDLSLIESFFHGKSSGVDALTCYRETPLHFLPGGEIIVPKKQPLEDAGEYVYFLLDSEVVLETGPLVSLFIEKMKEQEFSRIVKEDLSNLVHKYIGALTGGNTADPALLFRAISDLQWNHFRPMIPGNIEDAWIEGQVSNLYYLKLNGSGGGFVLGIAARESQETVARMLGDFALAWL